MAKHAILAASSAKRWLACTPSARLEEKMPDAASEYAAEGTRAHALAEQRLRRYLDTGKLPKRRPKGVEPEMWEATGVYVDFCVERINAARSETPDAEIYLEQRLDFSSWVPEGFGTGDLVIVSDQRVEVVDLKYGKGVPVSAEQNPQMMLYALGAYDANRWMYDPHSMVMTIVQPRLDSVSTCEIPIDALLAWGEAIKPRAQLAYRGEGVQVAGDHCRFCRCRKTCRTLADYMMEGIKTDLQPCEVTPAEIAATVLRAKSIKRWLDELEEYALAEALNGVSWPGLKVVEGRSNRSFTDESAVEHALLAAGYAAEEIYRPQELQTLTAIEKLVGKKTFPELLGAWVAKPPGKPTLAPEDDKRPAMELLTATADDFNDDIL